LDAEVGLKICSTLSQTKTRQLTVGQNVLVGENLGVLVLRQFLEVRVGLSQEQVNEEPEHFLKTFWHYLDAASIDRKHQTWLEKPWGDKQSSFLQNFVNYVRKKFYNIGTRAIASVIDKRL
jgi:hypothetical protein